MFGKLTDRRMKKRGESWQSSKANAKPSTGVRSNITLIMQATSKVMKAINEFWQAIKIDLGQAPSGSSD
jgi:hypothetical protein